MKNSKKYFLFLCLILILLFILVLPNKYTINRNNISINGTYRNSLNTFHSLVFDEDTMKYYNYTQYEKSNGDFEKKDASSYILTTGYLKGYEVIVDNNGIKVMKENEEVEFYEKISNTPTLQENN
ncbi:MAG: hypothetical protein ACRC3Y_02315 [Romboutsia sp.]|uniref:hypothetical protein n=1 Tax=Romboutsia sp. TaxID=1965302 RepID=UPI003F409A2E